MVKIPKIHIPGALYYVTSRGDDKNEIFRDESDYNAYTDLLIKYKKQYGFKLFAYCLLPTHLHLLLELKEGITVSAILHDLHANYTKYFNGKYSKKGHLFQERPKIWLVQKCPYLLPLSAYIHLNPKALGLSLELKNYPYSSYVLYLTEKPGNSKILYPDLSGEIEEIRQSSGEIDCRRYLADVPPLEMRDLGAKLKKNVILGSAEFEEMIKGKLNILSQAEGDSSRAFLCLKQVSRRLIYGVIAAAVILAGVSVYLYISGRQLKKALTNEFAQKEKEIDKKIALEKKKIKENLDEKYRADMVSYQAMSKRLEIEKKRIKELEERAGYK